MKLPVTIDPRYHDAVLFDLNGLVTDTASVHDHAYSLRNHPISTAERDVITPSINASCSSNW